jgi:hypothetical protein
LQAKARFKVWIGAVDAESVAPYVSWVEEGPAHHVVPVCVADKDVRRALTPAKCFLHQFQAQAPHSRAAVKNQQVASAMHFNARRIATGGATHEWRQTRDERTSGLGAAQIQSSLGSNRKSTVQLGFYFCGASGAGD